VNVRRIKNDLNVSLSIIPPQHFPLT